VYQRVFASKSAERLLIQHTRAPRNVITDSVEFCLSSSSSSLGMGSTARESVLKNYTNSFLAADGDDAIRDRGVVCMGYCWPSEHLGAPWRSGLSAAPLFLVGALLAALVVWLELCSIPSFRRILVYVCVGCRRVLRRPAHKTGAKASSLPGASAFQSEGRLRVKALNRCAIAPVRAGGFATSTLSI